MCSRVTSYTAGARMSDPELSGWQGPARATPQVEFEGDPGCAENGSCFHTQGTRLRWWGAHIPLPVATHLGQMVRFSPGAAPPISRRGKRTLPRRHVARGYGALNCCASLARWRTTVTSWPSAPVASLRQTIPLLEIRGMASATGLLLRSPHQAGNVVCGGAEWATWGALPWSKSLPIRR
jgi:hypothetical protein